MNHIEKLIEELCPNGVKFYSLNQIVEYSKSKIDSTVLNSTNFVGVDNLLPDKAGRTDATYAANSKTSTLFLPGDLLIGNIRPYLKKIWLADRSGGSSGDVLVLRRTELGRSLIDARFLYYLISSDDFFLFVMKFARGGKMPRGDKKSILNYRIPVPPLEVQREIVKVLDLFTKLEAELEAELAARRKQYEYYRDQLLKFPEDGGAPWVRLGEVLRLRNGKDYKHLGSGNVPVYGSGGVITYVDKSAYVGETVLIPRKGSVSSVFYVDGPVWTVDTCFFTEIDKSKVVPRYLYHYLVREDLSRLNFAGGVPTLTQSILSKLPLVLPPLSEQKRIAEILDKFDALVNDLESGLPAEIEARRKQYEYYRDKLLTFKELEPSA